MNECRQIESLLPPYVDGEASAADCRTVDAHLARCASCRAHAAAQRSVRHLLQAATPALRTETPPGLRTRLAATLVPPARPARLWGWRAVQVGGLAGGLFVASLALELVSPESNVLLAAQLAIDHVRCFAVERHDETPVSHADARALYAEEYGWDVTVPDSNAEAGLTLVAARRCPYWLGDHAHLLYRSGSHELSLYITPDRERLGEELAVLGHVERIWSANGRSYVLVGRGVPAADFARAAAYLERATVGA